MKFRERSILPGFHVAFAYTVIYLLLIVLVPLAGLFAKSISLGWITFWANVTQPQTLASLRLTFVTSLIASLLTALFGTVIAWVLVRYDFWGKRFVDTLIDLPFALPTAVAGIALSTIFAENGLVGKWLVLVGIKIAFTPSGIVVALIFIGLPFVVRSIQPILEDFDNEVEEAAVSLGATRIQTIIQVILPSITPAIFSGTIMAFSRSLGEYGSVVFIAGNIPFVSEVAPLTIMTKLESHNLAGATAIATVMLVASFVLLLFVNFIHRFSDASKASHS